MNLFVDEIFFSVLPILDERIGLISILFKHSLNSYFTFNI